MTDKASEDTTNSKPTGEKPTDPSPPSPPTQTSSYGTKSVRYSEGDLPGVKRMVETDVDSSGGSE